MKGTARNHRRFLLLSFSFSQRVVEGADPYQRKRNKIKITNERNSEEP